jgi:hypothetical protein
VGAPSLTTTGDTNTGFWFPAADTLAASTVGTERMRINSSGRVGIATSTPSTDAILTVNGSIAVAIPTRNAASANQIGVWTSDDPVDNARAAISFATVAGGSSSSSYIAFATNNYGVSGGERMRIDASGNVGIGTSSPGSKLDVSGNIRVSGNSQLQIFNGAGTSGVSIQTDNASPASMTLSTGGSERMRIDASGNVRIGTAALATTATDGFLYIPTCAGTPTGTPTAITGLAPLVINTTNNKLYFYSGGAWRDAGP